VFLPKITTAILVLGAAAALPAHGAIVYYVGASAEAAFDAAAIGLDFNTLTTFSAADLAPGGLYDANDTGVNFLGFNGAASSDLAVVGTALQPTVGGGLIRMDLPAGTLAFAIHFTRSTGATGNWCLEPRTTFSSATCDYNVVSDATTPIQFFGMISDTPITGPLWIGPATGSAIVSITSFDVGEAPEPSPLTLIGAGLVTFGFMRLRKRRRV
jgi:hypothetical protein